MKLPPVIVAAIVAWQFATIFYLVDTVAISVTDSGSIASLKDTLGDEHAQLQSKHKLLSCEARCPVYKRQPPPVCCNGKEYYDECRAKCAGAEDIIPGPCPVVRLCKCSDIDEPVCGDGKDYPNICVAQCADAKKIVPGTCPVCVCPLNYDPVCGDGTDYPNECAAKCACAKTLVRGPCCPPCAVRCSNEGPGVCADGVTYANACLTSCLCPRPRQVLPGKCPKGPAVVEI